MFHVTYNCHPILHTDMLSELNYRSVSANRKSVYYVIVSQIGG